MEVCDKEKCGGKSFIRFYSPTGSGNWVDFCEEHYIEFMDWLKK